MPKLEPLNEYLPFMIDLRRTLHRRPELSGEEYETRDFILEYMKKLSPDSVEVLFETGVKAVFYAENAEKTIAFRADIDGLSITEKNEHDFCSLNDGVMHACGHDGHMTIALTLAKLVSENKDKLTQNIVFIFQPAEEQNGGSDGMIKEGALRSPDVDEIYGLHIWPDVPKHTYGLKKGALMSEMTDVNVRLKGKAAHGAAPHGGNDALIAAASFIMQAQTLITRQTDPYEKSVLTFGTISGGEARNIVCGDVLIEGTLRVFNEKVSAHIKQGMQKILDGIELYTGVRGEYFETMSYPAVMNDGELVDKVAGMMAPEQIFDVQEVMMSEDFSFYQKEVPGCFIFLGAGDENSVPLHSADFDFDESIMAEGLALFAKIAGVA